MTYQDDLYHPKWRALRDKLIQSANFKCQKCGLQTRSLDIHHLTYLIGKKPWEYPISNFKVLCAKCHGQLHGRPPKFCSICGTEIEDKFDFCYSCKKQHDKEMFDKVDNLEKEINQYKAKLSSFSNNVSIDILQKKLDQIQSQLSKTQQIISDSQNTANLITEFDSLKREIVDHLNNLRPSTRISEPITSYASAEKRSKQNSIAFWSIIFVTVIMISIICFNRYQHLKNQASFFIYLQEKFNKQYFSTLITEYNGVKLIKVSYLFGDRGTIYIFPIYTGHLLSNNIINLFDSRISKIKATFHSKFFIVIGSGSKPIKPDSMYIIPLRDLNKNLNSFEINKYKRKNTDAKFYYDIENDNLK